MKQTIQFRKQRDLGAVVSDVFKFIRLSWKPLIGLIIKVTGIPLLVLLGTYIYYMSSAAGNIGMIGIINMDQNVGNNVIFALMLMFFAAMIYYTLLNGVILHFIKEYIKNDGSVEEEVVKDGVRNDFWRLMGTSFLVALIIMAGAMFCFFPGIYFGVVFSLAYSIVVFEGKEVGDTINYCFNLIKNEWWMTFLTLFVIYLLYTTIMMIFQIPQVIYVFTKAITMNEEISADPSAMFDWVLIALGGISMIAQYLLYTIIIIATAFIYFSLNEKKYFTGTFETIDSIGKRE